MSIKGDFKEVKQFWPTLSTPAKIFFAVSFTLSCLSITSIADKVFELRGFIRTTVEFYQSNISIIFVDFFLYFDIALAQVKIDAIIFLTLITSALIRAHFFYKAPGIALDTLTWLAFMVAIYKVNDTQAFIIIYTYIAVIIFCATIPFILKNISLSKVDMPNRLGLQLDKSKVTLAYRQTLLYIFTVIFFTSIVAAISEGLTRV